MKFIRNEKGFTLIELMVVILIIGILVAIAVPVFNSAKTSAQTRACQANLRTIDGAMETWKATNYNLPYPSLISTLVTDGFLKRLPSCPTNDGVYDLIGGGLTTSPTARCPNGHTY